MPTNLHDRTRSPGSDAARRTYELYWRHLSSDEPPAPPTAQPPKHQSRVAGLVLLFGPLFGWTPYTERTWRYTVTDGETVASDWNAVGNDAWAGFIAVLRQLPRDDLFKITARAIQDVAER